MDLTDLSLTDIVETVSHAKKIDQLPPDCRPPSTLSSTMSRPLMPRRIPISSSTSTLSRLAASRIPISALKCPQSSTNGLSTSTQGGRDIQDAFQSMQDSSMTPREGIAAKYQGVGASGFLRVYRNQSYGKGSAPLRVGESLCQKHICQSIFPKYTTLYNDPSKSPPTLPRIVPLSQMEYTRSASVTQSISKPPTSSPSESPSQRGSQSRQQRWDNSRKSYHQGLHHLDCYKSDNIKLSQAGNYSKNYTSIQQNESMMIMQKYTRVKLCAILYYKISVECTCVSSRACIGTNEKARIS